MSSGPVDSTELNFVATNIFVRMKTLLLTTKLELSTAVVGGREGGGGGVGGKVCIYI